MFYPIAKAKFSPKADLLSGLIAAVFGGRPGLISGATGAIAIVLVALVAEHRIEYMFAAVLLMGALQVLAGILRPGWTAAGVGTARRTLNLAVR